MCINDIHRKSAKVTDLRSTKRGSKWKRVSTITENLRVLRFHFDFSDPPGPHRFRVVLGTLSPPLQCETESNMKIRLIFILSILR